MDSLPKTPQPHPAFMPPFGMKSMPNTTVLSVIFGVLLLSVIGVGSAVVLPTDKEKAPVAAIPTATPTPDPTRTWKTYTSSLYGLSLKIPPGWQIQEGGGQGDTSLYFHSDEVFGNIRYYVYVSELANPAKMPLSDLLTQYYSHHMAFEEKTIGQNVVFLSTSAPARQGALSAFIPRSSQESVLSIALTPFDKEHPLREQARYEAMFRQMLSTLSVQSTSSASIVASRSAQISETSEAPTYWKLYVDRTYPFSFEYPPEYVLDTSRQGRILLDNKIEVVVTPINPEKCTGTCPVREKTSTVTVGKYHAKKYEGYFTSAGGQTPQRYLQYAFHESSQYYLLTLYEVGNDANVSKDRTPQPIPLSDIQTFEQLLATLQFGR